MASEMASAVRPLTIGIDARAATEVRAGRGRVVRELLRALAERGDPHTYVCYARQRWSEPLDARFRWRLISARDPIWHMRAAATANRDCDVFLSSNSYLTTLFLRKPSVVIVYDLVIFDTSIRPNWRSAVIERLTLAPAVRRAARLLCISQATADALISLIPAARAKVAVTTLGVSQALFQTAPEEVAKLPEPGFVLAVGTLEPRKNLPRLVAAYAALSSPLKEAHPLVVVGAAGWGTGPTQAALASLGRHCITLGHVPDNVLSELYRRCSVFCYPSLAEGFGLPVLEAMQAGAAVVTSSTSSLPEVGGDAVQYADPRSVQSIRVGLERVLESRALRIELGERARARSAQFSWERTADVTLEVLRQAAG